MKITVEPFTAALADLEPSELAQLLANRPEALRGVPPRTLGELSERLCDPQAIGEALGEAQLPHIQVAEALMALAGHTKISDLAMFLEAHTDNPEEHAQWVTHGVDWLITRGLASLSFAGQVPLLTANPGLAEIFPRPLGLGVSLENLLKRRSMVELNGIRRRWGRPDPVGKEQAYREVYEILSDGERIFEHISSAPRDIGEMLACISIQEKSPRFQQLPEFQFRELEYRAVAWAQDYGLIMNHIKTSYSEQLVEMPREVALGIRGPHYAAPFSPLPPIPDLQSAPLPEVARQSSAVAAEFAGHTLAIIDALAQTPVTLLKNNAVGARELTRLAKDTGASETQVRLALELAQLIEILERRETLQGSPELPQWRNSSPAHRYVQFLLAWWHSRSVFIADRDEMGKKLPALGRREHSLGIRASRRSLFSALISLPEGMGASREELIPAALWQRPAIELPSSDEDEPFRTHWREAEMLGLIALDSLTPLGKALLTGDPELETRAAEALPASTDSALFGSDLTAMVSGAPSARVSALLDAAADREGQGGAVTWRFSPGSVRRALDSGWTAERLGRELAGIAAGSLPEALTYLLADVARRHGELIVQPAASCLTSRDAALLAQVVADRSLNSLGLRLLTAEVLASTADAATTLAALRQAGYLPMPATPAPPPQLPNAPAPEPNHTSAPKQQLAQHEGAGQPWAQVANEPGPPRPDQLLELSRELLAAGTRTLEELTPLERQIANFSPKLPVSAVRLLAEAVTEQQEVIITFRSGQGKVTTRQIRELRLTGSVLWAWCLSGQGERSFVLARILAVSAPQH